MKQRDVIRHETHSLANTLLGRRDLPRLVETRQLWADDDGPAKESCEEESESAE